MNLKYVILPMEIFNYIKTSLSNKWEERAQRDLLMMGRMACIVDNNIDWTTNCMRQS